MFEQHIQKGGTVTYFKQFTNDLSYLQSLCHSVGCRDLNVTPKMMRQKVNSHNKGRVNSYQDIPKYYRDRLEAIAGSFNKKYVQL